MIRYKSGYKYQLCDEYVIQLPFKPESDLDIMEDFYIFGIDGLLTIKAGYAYDGPSGPAFDTKNFMRGSLVHDVLYQMMREEKISQIFKDQADQLLRTICLEDGMSAIRAWWVYQGVKFGGKASTESKNDKTVEIAP